MEVSKKIINILKIFNPDSNINLNSSLEDISIDSMNIISFIILLEEEFKFSIPDHEITTENFSKVKDIENYIKLKIESTLYGKG